MRYSRLIPTIACAAVALPLQAQLTLPFSGTDPSASVSSFQIIKSGISGRANTLYITSASNTSDVLLLNTVGMGRGIYASINNSANAQMALRADSNGSGISVFGYMTGTGKAGSFRITNPSNINNALYVQTNGGGAALSVSPGTGRAAEFGGAISITNSTHTYAIDADGTPGAANLTAHTSSSGVYVYNYGINGNNDATGLYVGTGVSNGTAILASTFGAAIWGIANGAGKAVVGQAGITGYALYGFGSSAVTGSKSFQIDHPDDPENLYLQHYCTEGPEPINAYSGIAQTDARGFASVRLPEYFETLNKEPRFQLTVIDSSDIFVLAKVVREVENNTFVIRTNKPRVRVSWEVKAIRNDPWIKRQGYQDVKEKDEKDRGKYLEPELYGMPEEARIGSRANALKAAQATAAQRNSGQRH